MIETMTRVVQCGVCHKSFTLSMTKSGYHKWIAGELIQRALPELSPQERELLISRTCSPCFDDLFNLPK